MDLNGNEITTRTEDTAEISGIVTDVRNELAAIWTIASQSLSQDEEACVTERLQAILSHTNDLVSVAEANLDTMHAYKDAALDFQMQLNMAHEKLRNTIHRLAEDEMIRRLAKMLQIQFNMTPRDSEWIAGWIMGKTPFYVSPYDSEDIEALLKQLANDMWEQAAESPEILEEDYEYD